MTAKSFVEAMDDLRAAIREGEAAHQAEHGCTYGTCACRCRCAEPVQCSKEPLLCMLCAHYDINRDSPEHGLLTDIPRQIAELEARLAQLRSYLR